MLNFGATPASGHSSIGCPSSLSPTPRPSSGPSTERREPTSRRGSPTGASRSRYLGSNQGLRVNSRSIRSGCRPRQCSLSRAQDFQYFRVVRFDFHRARVPDDYWILEALPASIAWLFGCAVSGSRHGRRAAACARIATTFACRIRTGTSTRCSAIFGGCAPCWPLRAALGRRQRRFMPQLRIVITDAERPEPVESKAARKRTPTS